MISKLVTKNTKKIVMLVLDGLGDVGDKNRITPLECAKTPNLDKIAIQSDLGLTVPIEIGITPGSGPAHLSLFGYDAVKYNVGRGLLSALGLGFRVLPGDLCVRLNFCTMEGNKIIDRRAGRISTEENVRLLKLIKKHIKVTSMLDVNEKLLSAFDRDADKDLEVHLLTEEGHRAVLILRGKEFSDHLTDSDPQKDGLDLLKIEGDDEIAQNTAKILNDITRQVSDILKGEKANGILMRGYSMYKELPNFSEKYQLRSLGLAVYPMYKGLAKLCGMDVIQGISDFKDTVNTMKKNFDQYDFFFLHFKDPDKYGEDGNLEGKINSIEKIDEALELLSDLNIDTLIVCGDHSTPAKMAGHSWHPVPFMIRSNNSRNIVKSVGFSEKECLKGELGIFKAKHVMTLALSHAGKLKKFGA